MEKQDQWLKGLLVMFRLFDLRTFATGSDSDPTKNIHNFLYWRKALDSKQYIFSVN